MGEKQEMGKRVKGREGWVGCGVRIFNTSEGTRFKNQLQRKVFVDLCVQIEGEAIVISIVRCQIYT